MPRAWDVPTIEADATGRIIALSKSAEGHLTAKYPNWSRNPRRLPSELLGALEAAVKEERRDNRPASSAAVRVIPTITADRFLIALGKLATPKASGIQTVRQVVDRLPMRLRQVLNLLLAGDSEKQVAIKMQLSQHTIHRHVGRLYQTFEVSSRGELMAKFLNV